MMSFAHSIHFRLKFCVYFSRVAAHETLIHTALTTTWNMHGVINTISMVSDFVSRKIVIYKQNTARHTDRAGIIRFWWSCQSAFMLVWLAKWTHHLFRSCVFFTHKFISRLKNILAFISFTFTNNNNSNNSFCHHFTAIAYHIHCVWTKKADQCFDEILYKWKQILKSTLDIIKLERFYMNCIKKFENCVTESKLDTFTICWMWAPHNWKWIRSNCQRINVNCFKISQRFTIIWSFETTKFSVFIIKRRLIKLTVSKMTLINNTAQTSILYVWRCLLKQCRFYSLNEITVGWTDVVNYYWNKKPDRMLGVFKAITMPM